MVGHHDLGTLGYQDAGLGHALLHQLGNLVVEFLDIQCHAVADDIGHMGIEHAGRQCMQGKLPEIVDNGVSRVGPPLKTDDHIGLLGKQIGDFSLSFVAPVGTHNRFNHNIPPCAGFCNADTFALSRASFLLYRIFSPHARGNPHIMG